MHNSEEESIESDLNVRDTELFLDDDIDAGEGVDWHGVDKTGE